MRRGAGRRIRQVVNSTHISPRISTSRSPSTSVCGWIFALILCCLPGLSWPESALIVGNAQNAATSPTGMLQTTNTQVAINTHDTALTSSQRLLSQATRTGAPCQNTDTNSPDPSGPAQAVWPLPASSDLRALVCGQGYDVDVLRLVTRYTAAPYSPRSPPVPA